jgi:NAD dependent epimerase/dehydratase family enzyme
MALGEFGDTLIKGQKVLPAKLMEMGFQFDFPEVGGALKDLVLGHDSP